MNKEQWEELKRLYGDNAHLMCEYEETAHWTNCKNWVSATKNDQIDRYINTNTEWYRIKQSAALPFDKIAAEKGDIVEHQMFDDTWEEISTEQAIIFYEAGFSRETQRMQHPRRVGVVYGD